jgi:hypothetical protein
MTVVVLCINLFQTLDLDDAPIQVVDLHRDLKRSPRDDGEEDFGQEEEVTRAHTHACAAHSIVCAYLIAICPPA